MTRSAAGYDPGPMPTLRHLPRSVLTLVVGLLVTPVAALVAIAVAHFDPTSPWIERITTTWSKAWLLAAGVDLVVEGSENLDPGRSYVVVANHASNLDIMVAFLAMPLPIRFLAKTELFRIPLLSRAMRAIGIVEVDRQGRTAVHEQINHQAKDLVAKGRSLIIYSEGTRSRTGRLGPFKKGAFTIAVATGIPVLPIAIYGTREAWPPRTLDVKGGRVVVAIEPAIETEHLGHRATGELRDTVHRRIEERLHALAQSYTPAR